MVTADINTVKQAVDYIISQPDGESRHPSRLQRADILTIV